MAGQLTAFFLIGEPEQFYARINEIFLLNLYEGVQPLFVLRPQNGQWKEDDIHFIPTEDHLLDDAFVILAVYYLKDDIMHQLLGTYSDALESNKPLNFNDILLIKREEMYAVAKKLNWSDTKITLTMFSNTVLNQTIQACDTYNDFLEVYRPRMY